MSTGISVGGFPQGSPHRSLGTGAVLTSDAQLLIRSASTRLSCIASTTIDELQGVQQADLDGSVSMCMTFCQQVRRRVDVSHERSSAALYPRDTMPILRRMDRASRSTWTIPIKTVEY